MEQFNDEGLLGLNGAAKGQYKLAGPHEAGMAIMGKSIQPFIELAKSL